MKERLIVALDYSDSKKALDLVSLLDKDVEFYKVGMQLFYAAGFEIIEKLKKKEKKVFLDLKIHDIPNTAAGAVESLGKLGVDLLTLHAGGGRKMMESAAEAKYKNHFQEMKMIGVTVLTSMSSQDARELGWNDPIPEQAERLARLAQLSGLDGVVASPQEVVHLKEKLGKDFIVVTPGIRMATDDVGDQNRVATPHSAVANGSDYLVVGRPITAALNPKAAVEAILKEMIGA